MADHDHDWLADACSKAGLGEEVLDALTQWLGVQAERERFARLEQAGHSVEERIPLAKVFVDLEAADVPVGEGEEGRPEVTLLVRALCEPRRDEPEWAIMDEEESDEGHHRMMPPHIAMARRRSCDGFVVLGGPGQGKSTLGQLLCQLHRAWLLKPRLARLAVDAHRDAVEAFTSEAAQQDLGRPAELRLPLRIVLPEAAAWLANQAVPSVAGKHERPKLLHYLVERARRDGVTLRADDLLLLLRGNDWLLVLDGLDEVPASSNRDELLKAVRELLGHLIVRSSHGLVIATTRPQGYAGELDHLGVRLASRYLVPLSRDRAMEYARRLVRTRFALDRQETVLGRLEQAVSGSTTARLMRTPLQVTILATLVDRIGRAPSERWTLFKEYYRVVYEREMERSTPAAQLLREYRGHIDKIHAQVGLLLQVAEERSGGTEAGMSPERFAEVVDAVLTEDEIGKTRRDVLVRDLGRAVRERLVLLVEVSPGKLGFEVRSIQEFMAAWALSQKEALVEERARQILKSAGFRNVLLFIASKAFTELTDLREVIVHACRLLNEDPADPIARAARAGSVLALEILEEGSVLKQDKYVRRLVELAVELLSLPPSRLQVRLALVCVVDREARTVALPILRSRLEEQLQAAVPEQRLGGWPALLTLIHARSRWATELAEARWPEDLRVRLAVLDVLEAVNLAAPRWLTEKIAQAPAEFTQEVLLPHLHTRRLLELRSLPGFEELKLSVPFLHSMQVLIDGEPTPFTVILLGSTEEPESEIAAGGEPAGADAPHAAVGRWSSQSTIELEEIPSVASDGIPVIQSMGWDGRLDSDRYHISLNLLRRRFRDPVHRELAGIVANWILLSLSTIEGSARTLDPPFTRDELESLWRASTDHFPLNALRGMDLLGDDSAGWKALLDEIGASGRWDAERVDLDGLIGELSRLYLADPERTGILHLLAGLTPGKTISPIPSHLLDLNRFTDDRERADAALLRLTQTDVAPDLAAELAKDLARSGIASRALRLLTALPKHAVHDSALLALWHHAPPEDWQLARRIAGALTAALARRTSGLTDPGTWDRLQLPLPYPDSRLPSVRPPAPERRPLRLDSITLQNLRLFADFTLQPAPPDNGHGQWLVLLGENGVGKSTLLRALALALVDVTSQPTRLPAPTFAARWRRRGVDTPAQARINIDGRSYIAEIYADPDRGPEQERLRQRVVQIASIDADQGAQSYSAPVFAYGCRRGSALGGANRQVADDPGTEVYTLFDEGADLVHAETWFLIRENAALKDPEGQPAHVFRAVQQALQKLLGVDEIWGQGEEVRVRGKGIGEMPLAALSDGYLTMMGWAIDLLAKWIKRAEIRQEPIPADFTETMTGLVLIDELDLHLHPEWQRRVIDDVRAVFPRMSFVVTTHNPLTLLGAKAREIWRLRRVEGDRVVADQGREEPALLTSSDIYEAYFGIRRIFPDERGEDLDRYGFLARNPVRTDEEEAELAELLRRLRERGIEPDWKPVPRQALPPYPGDEHG